MSQGLPAVEDKPRYVAAMFGRIAGRYDLMNSLMTGGQDRAWRRAVADVVAESRPISGWSSRDPAANRGPLAVLDVGTGTGKLAEAILDRQPAARVVGVDFTFGMLQLAPRTLRLASADALQLPFADTQFDAVVSAFVMRNVADVAQGIAEQVRVLREGGTLVVLETTPGPPGLLRPLHKLYFRRAVPVIGQLVAGDASAYTYLPASTLAFLEPARLADVLRRHGLVNVQVQRLALGSVAITSGQKPASTRA